MPESPIRTKRLMTRIQWLACWDTLRQRLELRTTWGRNQIFELMDEIERKKMREVEAEICQENNAQ